MVEVRGDDLLLRGGARAVGRGDGGGAGLGVPLESMDLGDIVDITSKYCRYDTYQGMFPFSLVLETVMV